MPYLKAKDATRLKASLPTPTSAGELNYCIAQLTMNYLGVLAVVDYSALNAAIGALESAKLEIYRRLVAPYENGKIREHGDCFHEFIRKHNIPTLL